MDGKTTFTKFEVEALDQPLLFKLNKLKRNINKNFKYYDIRKVDIDYDKHKNFYKYMKELAYLKYRKIHLIKIIRRKYFNIFTKKDLYDLKRRYSHYNPYHKKSYHTLIYRNLYNYQYKPYVLPLENEDKIDRLNITDIKIGRKKVKKRLFINPYLDEKIKSISLQKGIKNFYNFRYGFYLTKVNQRLVNRNLKNEKLKYNKIDPNNIRQIKKSNSLSINNNNFNRNNSIRNNKQLEKFPKIINEKITSNSVDNNIYNENNSSNYNIQIIKALNLNKTRMTFLPKIKDDIISTITNSKKLEKDLILFKYKKKDILKIKENKYEINKNNNLLNVSPRKLYKLFFGIKKITKPKKLVKIKNKNPNNDINIKTNTNILISKDLPFSSNSKDINNDINNDDNKAKDDNKLNENNEDSSTEKKIISFNGL